MQNVLELFLLQDYTKKFSAVCAGCKKAITPKQGQVVQHYQIKKANFKKYPQIAQHNVFRKEAQYFTADLIHNRSDVI